MDITELLAFSVKNRASDLHLSSGLPPMIRVDGDVRRINVPVQGWAAWEARYAANGVAAEELMRSPTTTVSCSGRATRARTRPMSRPGSLSSMSRT